jgi:hypothetical protein
MKKDKNLPDQEKIKSGTGSDPVNKFKKGSKGITLATLNNITTGAVESVKARSGGGLANKGTNIEYSEE